MTRPPLLRAAAAAFLVFAGSSGRTGAAQFHVPVHAPPRLDAPAEGSGPGLLLPLGWFRASAAGLSVDGPGGGWEVGIRAGRRAAVHLHCDAFVFQGRGEPAASGRRDTGGLSGGLEFDASWPISEAARWYVGFLGHLTVMDVGSPLAVRLENGKIRAELDIAHSFLVGVPVGLTSRSPMGADWRRSAALSVVAYPAGSTLFSYTAAGGIPGAFGADRKIDPHLALAGRLGVEYVPWRLGLEAGGGVSTASGNNESLTQFFGGLTWRIL
ncbi:MAG: hypothetical protein HY554_04935 [Elusimicrobia bacterium]|nr:hypothetical protein [Elusimicrobiota bacterium]